MTGEELGRLHQNPFYLQAYEFFLEESARLLELLEQMAWSPATAEQREAIRIHCERTKKARLVLQQLGELVLSPTQSSDLPNPIARGPLDDIN